MVDRARPNWKYIAEPPPTNPDLPLEVQLERLTEYVFRQFQLISLATEAMRSASDDLVIRDSSKGIVLRDSQTTPHYWRITVNTLGALVVTDLGAVRL